MRRDLTESFKEYACRWKEVASLVQPPLTKRELNALFVDTLPPPYYDKLVGTPFSEFADLVFSVGRIEDGIKKGKIKDTDEGSRVDQEKEVSCENIQVVSPEKKSKRKLEQNSKGMQWPKATNYQPPWECSPTFHEQGPKRKKAKRYHLLPLSYTELLPLLIQNGQVAIVPTKPRNPPYPHWFDPYAKCLYHGGVVGHSIEDCTAFKDKVQILINTNTDKFQQMISQHASCKGWVEK